MPLFCYIDIVAIQAVMKKAGGNMDMTDSQFKGFVRFVLDDIREVLENLEDGSKEKEKLQKVADNLQQTLED